MRLNWIVWKMKSLKLHETKKLFFKKYVYKLLLSNELNNLFRSENQKNKHLDYARDKLDEFASSYRNGQPLVQTFFRTEREIPMEHYIDAKNLYLLLKNQKDFTIRVENGASISVYTNDYDLLENISSKMKTVPQGFWEPAVGTKHLLTNDNIIVNTKPEFPIRIIFKHEKIPSDFANWLRANRDKSRIGDKALQCIDNNEHVGNFYFHVRDEKVLSIVHMLVGYAIRGIYNLVYMPPTIDK